MSGSTQLLTGFPSNELACRVLSRLLEVEPLDRVVCIVPRGFLDAATAWLATRTEGEQRRVELVEGDVSAIDMGLSGREYRELGERVERIHHCAAVTYSGAPLAMAERVNVGGAYEVLEFARNAKRVSRLVHWSTLLATAPDPDGTLREGTLRAPRSTKLLETRYRAEKLMLRARGEVPVTVLRPAPLIGDTVQGALRRLEGFHLLIHGILSAPREVPLPLLGDRNAPFYALPIDYAVDAGLAVVRARDTAGGVFHLIERSPPRRCEVFETLCALVGRAAPRGELPLGVARLVLGLPGLSRVVHAQQAMLEEIGHAELVDDAQARVVLNRAGMQAPSLLAHLPKLIEHVSKYARRESPRLAPTSAP